MYHFVCLGFFFQAEDGIRDAQESRGLGDVYKRQALWSACRLSDLSIFERSKCIRVGADLRGEAHARTCLLYTSDAADDLLCVDLGGRRIIKKKNHRTSTRTDTTLPIPHNNSIDIDTTTTNPTISQI